MFTGSLFWGWMMKRLLTFMGVTLKSLGHCISQAVRQAKEYGENQPKNRYRDLRETEGGPPPFHEETCTTKPFFVGVISDPQFKEKRRERVGQKDLPDSEDYIVPGPEDSVGPKMGTSVNPK
jgi:hypothetical protein